MEEKEHTPLTVLVPLIARMARRLSRSYCLDPEDAAQEALLRLVGASRSYDPNRGTRLRTYARIRARGAVIDMARNDARRARELPMPSPAEEVRGLRESSMESREMLLRFVQYLPEGLSRLGERQRRVLIQRYFRGMSMREAAHILGLSVATVHREEQRALETLRRGFLRSSCKKKGTR